MNVDLWSAYMHSTAALTPLMHCSCPNYAVNTRVISLFWGCRYLLQRT